MCRVFLMRVDGKGKVEKDFRYTLQTLQSLRGRVADLSQLVTFYVISREGIK